MKTKIILASTSPRRIDLMKQIGLHCEVKSPDADETPRRGESPAKLVARLAREKAQSVARKSKPSKATNTLIIAADTIVVDPSGKTILNKPRNTREARKMLKMLAGKTHTVLTGYCVYEIDKAQSKSVSKSGQSGRAVHHHMVRVVRSKVTMRKLSPKQIAAYVATGEPMDKAGAYAAQGMGMALVEKINGSYSNVVGLPVSQLLMDLETHFGVKALSSK
jgi:septum formation protein